ncbi:MAG: hypothetical protein IKY92_07775 [Akkermansia sp.]|nr:hypothetical protein [Akkermansia sp.]
MSKYLDWQFRFTTWLTLAVALVCLVCAYVLPDSFGDKNSPIETVQMVIVAIGLYVTCTAKDRKVLYVFASLCLFFILAREVNYGRTLIIFADPENANKFPKWKDMEYGWVAHLCVGLYMVWLLVYFIWRKVWKEVWEVLRTCRIPISELLLAAIGLLAGVFSESLHNCLLEELGEVIMYVGAICILYLYSRNKVTRV